MKLNHPELDYGTFVPELLRVAPEFRPTYDEHLGDNFGELLPHVLMGDFTRFFIEAYRRSISGEADADRWRRVVVESLNLMEQAIQSPDEKLRDLISLSFLESLDWAEELYNDIKSLLGPELREELRYYDPN